MWTVCGSFVACSLCHRRGAGGGAARGGARLSRVTFETISFCCSAPSAVTLHRRTYASAGSRRLRSQMCLQIWLLNNRWNVSEPSRPNISDQGATGDTRQMWMQSAIIITIYNKADKSLNPVMRSLLWYRGSRWIHKNLDFWPYSRSVYITVTS